MSAEESITEQIFSDPDIFDEVNEFVRDILGYRKSVMRVWLSKPQIESLRPLFPNLSPSTLLARDTIMSKLDDLPLCQSSDPETTIERLKKFLRMTQKHHHHQHQQNPWVTVEPQSSRDSSKDDEIRRLLQLLLKNYKPPERDEQ